MSYFVGNVPGNTSGYTAVSAGVWEYFDNPLTHHQLPVQLLPDSLHQ